MIKEYLSWIGLFSRKKKGLDLLTDFRIFEYLIFYVEVSGKKDHILTVVLYSMNYSKEGKAREFL